MATNVAKESWKERSLTCAKKNNKRHLLRMSGAVSLDRQNDDAMSGKSQQHFKHYQTFCSDVNNTSQTKYLVKH